MIVERCKQCGFDGDRWTDVGALEATAQLPARWVMAVSGLTSPDGLRRPIDGMWSIAEYAEHVREMLFGMRFLLESAVGQPGTDLGTSPESRFDPEPRTIDLELALTGIAEETAQLLTSFSVLPTHAWASTVVLDGADVDPHWIVQHALHDATHHILDIERLRDAL